LAVVGKLACDNAQRGTRLIGLGHRHRAGTRGNDLRRECLGLQPTRQPLALVIPHPCRNRRPPAVEDRRDLAAKAGIALRQFAPPRPRSARKDVRKIDLAAFRAVDRASVPRRRALRPVDPATAGGRAARMTEQSLLTAGLLLSVASLVAMLCQRLRLPYSVGLVLAGIGLALSPFRLDLPLSRDLIFMVFLPPLIFEAALHLKWRDFMRDLPVTTLLAFPGVAIATAVVATGAHLLLGWSWIAAGLFGGLIAATDPVSVIAAFREMKAEPRLGRLVETESLLNDGTAAVVFSLLAAIALGAQAAPLHIGLSFLWTVFGGISVGAAIAGALLLVVGRTQDHLVEITLTTIAAYASFLLADHFGMSGVLATLTAGILIGNLGWRGPISENGRGHIHAFWAYAAFLTNSIIFMLIGGEVVGQPLSSFILPSAVAIPLVLLGRVLAVYPLCGLVAGTRLRVALHDQHILVWGGLRGALALALALALPQQIAERQEIIVVAFAVVAFSIFVQGLSMPPLMRRLSAAQRTEGAQAASAMDE
jgi:CPA1 family monovalent cation:H+ antiporter